MRFSAAGLLSILAMLGIAAGATDDQVVQKWSLAKAVEILNSSPWARHETFTSVVAGVGSGVSI